MLCTDNYFCRTGMTVPFTVTMVISPDPASKLVREQWKTGKHFCSSGKQENLFILLYLISGTYSHGGMTFTRLQIPSNLVNFTPNRNWKRKKMALNSWTLLKEERLA